MPPRTASETHPSDLSAPFPPGWPSRSIRKPRSRVYGSDLGAGPLRSELRHVADSGAAPVQGVRCADPGRSSVSRVRGSARDFHLRRVQPSSPEPANSVGPSSRPAARFNRPLPLPRTYFAAERLRGSSTPFPSHANLESRTNAFRIRLDRGASQFSQRFRPELAG